VRRSDPGRLIAREQRRMLVDGDLLPSMLADGRLPAMQEMVIGAVPGPIGGTSPAVLIFVGLYLMYRQMASWRGALAALVGALAAWLILPLWIDKTLTIPLLCLVDLGILGSITLMGYVVLSQPLPLIVLVLAPSVQPLARRGRIAFGLLLGAAVVTAIWFIGRPEAGYLGLVAVGLFSRSLDRLHRSPYVR
jgi:hypothetical protein